MQCYSSCESVTYISLSIRNQRGRSALLLASKEGYAEIVKCLLEKGAKIDDKDEVRSYYFDR
jgi:ankyrin repeat protein